MKDRRLSSRTTHCHVEGIRSEERQRTRWIDNIQKKAKAYNMDMRRGQLMTWQKTENDEGILRQPHHRLKTDGREKKKTGAA